MGAVTIAPGASKSVTTPLLAPEFLRKEPPPCWAAGERRCTRGSAGLRRPALQSGRRGSMAERSLWGQLAWNLVGHRNTLRRPHEWLPWEVKSSQDAAASLTFLLRSSRSPDALDHHHEEHFATVPTSQPADPPTGNILDDLLLVLKRGQNETRCAVSIKSNRQLSKAGFNAE